MAAILSASDLANASGRRGVRRPEGRCWSAAGPEEELSMVFYKITLRLVERNGKRQGGVEVGAQPLPDDDGDVFGRGVEGTEVFCVQVKVAVVVAVQHFALDKVAQHLHVVHI